MTEQFNNVKFNQRQSDAEYMCRDAHLAAFTAEY